MVSLQHMLGSPLSKLKLALGMGKKGAQSLAAEEVRERIGGFAGKDAALPTTISPNSGRKVANAWVLNAEGPTHHRQRSKSESAEGSEKEAVPIRHTSSVSSLNVGERGSMQSLLAERARLKAQRSEGSQVSDARPAYFTRRNTAPSRSAESSKEERVVVAKSELMRRASETELSGARALAAYGKAHL